MRFKFFLIMLFLNFGLMASEEFEPHSSTVNLDQQLADHAKLRDDRCKFILLNAVRDLDDSNLDRGKFRKVRDNLNKFCEDAKDCEGISGMLSDIKKQHQYCQYVSKRWLSNERVGLKKILNQRIDTENLKSQESTLQQQTVPTAPVVASVVSSSSGNNDK